MKIMRTILWYDLETFGLNPRYDRIAQFAAVRTDMDLNIIEEPILLYSKLTPDYVPNPSACLVTGITPLIVNKKGIPEAEMIAKIRDAMMVPDTITAGFNNIKFDDECIRTTLYRNLYDPYEREYRNRCSRWDIINLVRATKDLRPDGIVFDTKNPETGTTSFKLTDLTAENNIEQVGAHDALVDVYATINIARLIKSKQPQLWDYAINHRQKVQVSSVIKILEQEPFLYTCPLFANEKGCTRPLLPLFMKDKSSDIYCFDLTMPIPENPSLSDYQNSGIVKVSINKCPFVASLKVLDAASEKRLGYTKAWVINKAQEVKRLGVFNKEKLLGTIEPFVNEVQDPDVSIYSSMVSDPDKAQLSKIKKLSPEAMLKSGEHLFDDDKYHKLLWRYVARNYPKALSPEDLAKWKNFCALRLINPPVQEALTLDKYQRTVDELLNSLETTAEQKKILMQLKEYGEILEKRVLN